MRLFGLHIHQCSNPWDEAPPWALELRLMLRLILRNQEAMMAQIDDLETAVKANTDAEDSAEALIVGIAKQIADLKAAGTDPATAARIQTAADALNARAARLAAAVVANTPSA